MKGKTNNPNGRPKGAQNKATRELKEWINDLLDGNRSQLKKDFKTLSPAKRWMIAEKLMAYVIPKQQSLNADINLNKLSDDQIDKIIDSITQNIDDE